MEQISKVRKCYSCGKTLQSENPEAEGYINPKVLNKPGQNFLFCDKCFEIERFRSTSNEPMIDEDFKTVIAEAKKNDCLLVYVVNLLTFETSFSKEVVSLIKGMKMMGLRKDQIKVIPSDEKFEINVKLLTKEIEKDVKEGKRPFLIVGTCGTTNTGSIDPVDDLALLAKKYDMWLHYDGAYGGSIFFSEIYKNLGKGMEQVDSFSWDTHKWSLQGYSSSTVIAKDRDAWINTFNEHPEYLEDVRQSEHLDGWDRGIEMSRPFRAIKLWFTLQCLGTDRLADVIDYSFFNATTMEKELLKNDYWEIMAPSKCAALNFRLAPKNVKPMYYDEMTHKLSELINDEGYAYILTTTLRGNTCCRVCLINGNTTTEDILNTVEHLNKFAKKLIKEYSQK